MKGLKEIMDELHKRRIDASECVVIINKDKYMGTSTIAEKYHAIKENKPIYWYYTGSWKKLLEPYAVQSLSKL